MDQFELEVAVSLLELGIKPKLKGYRCITAALTVLRENPTIIHNIGKFYAAVGSKVNASPGRVVHNITNALFLMTGDQKSVIGTDREMSATEFVATLSEVIKIRLADKEGEDERRLSESQKVIGSR